MTKQQEQIINAYKRTDKRSIYECYKKPSNYKLNAEQTIKNEMVDYNGFGYRVLTYNINKFTCAYKYSKVNKYTGEVFETLVYHTPTKRLEINLLG